MGCRFVALAAVMCATTAGCSSLPSPATRDAGSQGDQGIPTVVIVDASGSMNTPDAPGPRIDAAKAAVGQLVDGMADGTAVGVVVYGTATGSSPEDRAAGCRDVSTPVALGPLDRNQIRSAVGDLRASGYTPIALSLQTAANQLPSGDSPQAIVLVSDGEDTCGTPPCEIAGQLKTSRPGLTISTIGFKTGDAAGDQLGCVAAVTGGVFVTADNAAQLAARLGALRDVDAARAALSSAGIGDITLGSNATDIRAAHPDFPELSGDDTVVVYRDCDFGFVGGVLDAITPRGEGRTIDGVGRATPLVKAVELYGQPLAVTDNGDRTVTLIFDADPNGDAAYRVRAEGYTGTGAGVAGTITTITLCRCKPRSATRADVATFGGYGPIKLGMTESEVNAVYAGLDRQRYYNCTVLAAAPGADYRYLSVWIDDATRRVTGINPPRGTITDRGVGEGSRASDVTRAYETDAILQRSGTMGGMALIAAPINAPAGHVLAFVLEPGDRIGAVTVGRMPGSEGCKLYEPMRQAPAEATCDEGDIAADIGQRLIVERCYPGWAYVTTGEAGDAQSLLRVERGRWSRYAGFPSAIGCEQARKDGVPERELSSFGRC